MLENQKRNHPDAIDATQEDTGHAHGLHEGRVHREVVDGAPVLLRPRLVERREDEGLVELVLDQAEVLLQDGDLRARRLEIGKETTHGIVRWTRVVLKK